MNRLNKLLLCLLLLASTSVFSQSIGTRPLQIEPIKVPVSVKHPGISKVHGYRVAHSDVPQAFNGFRIAFVSDLHYPSKFTRETLVSLTRVLRDLHPDLLLLGGDYQEICEVVSELFDSLAAVHPPYGIAGVLGNNDYERCTDEIRNKMQALGMHLLEHDTLCIQKEGQSIVIAGVRDPFNLSKNGVSPILLCDSTEFAILLTHTPDYVEEVNNSTADLALAGHTHGGQVRILGYTPKIPSRYGTRFRSGLKYSSQGVPILITNGIGTSSKSIRIGAPSEVLLIELHPL